jgi:cytochrome c
MITFALENNLWVAYSTDSCSLYKAWTGGVDFEGAVYNMQHGPQPMSVGNAWFQNKYRQPWTIVHKGKIEKPTPDYKGHRYLKNGSAEIMYDLVLSDGTRIRVNEKPEFIEKNRQKGLERTFELSNVPDNTEVKLEANLRSVVAESNIITTGKWTTAKLEADNSLENISTVKIEGSLQLNPSGKTTFTTLFVATATEPNPFDARKRADAVSATTTPGEQLMAKNDCRTCHNPQVKTVGPAYVDIALRYKNTPENVELLTKKIVNGGSGVWGAAAMSAHPDLKPTDAQAMLAYILKLDIGKDDGEGSTTPIKPLDVANLEKPEYHFEETDLVPGLLVDIFPQVDNPQSFSQVKMEGTPEAQVVIGNINAGNSDFGPFKDNFALTAEGFLFIEQDDNILFQLSSDDGSRMYLNNRLLIDNDGSHGMEAKEAEVALKAGYHSIRIDYFQGGGGRGISLKWANSKNSEMAVVPENRLFHKRGAGDGLNRLNGGQTIIPGDGSALREVHPSYNLYQARPPGFLPKVSGMDFLPDGRMVVCTWDAMGAVYIIENPDAEDPNQIRTKRIAQGLAEPLGLKVVDKEIYVLQKQELTKLVDSNNDDIIDEYQCFAKGWKASANFHEFAFGLAFKDDYFFATLAIAILPGGASARPQINDRGKVVKISKKDGSIEFIARGLRTPNGIGIGPDNEIFIADNQGDWLPSSKILHLKPNAFFGSYAVDSAAIAHMPVQQPVVWLPQDEIGNSPTQPALLKDGPYKGQLIHGDVCYGGLQRVFMEKVNGDYQGCVFRFTQGLEAGTNRITHGPDGSIYIGGIGNPGNWSQEGKFWYGLQRMQYNGISTFEMLAVRAKTDGLEIEFTEPLPENNGWNTDHYRITQWKYLPTNQYGGPKLDETTLEVASANVSTDRKKVFLEIPGIKIQHVVHIRLNNLPLSSLDHEIWTTEAWYTMNNIPNNTSGTKTSPISTQPTIDNTLSAAEKAAGWQLLFDGKTRSGWHNFGKSTLGTSWVIQDAALHLNAKPNPDGHWQAEDGGDILTDNAYTNYELKLDWKIGPCGNSGIIYNVIEDPSKFSYAWQTGPEMQVLDNNCHPDARFEKHRAGDLYDLIACKYETVKPAGQWNHVRIVSQDGKIEHWLNNRKLVQYDMNSPSWKKLIENSKFNTFPDFGKSKSGRISLQDHGDPVWYKNIKIKPLK